MWDNYDDFVKLKTVIDRRKQIANELIMPLLASLYADVVLCPSGIIRLPLGMYNGIPLAASISPVDLNGMCDIELVTGVYGYSTGSPIRLMELGYNDKWTANNLTELTKEIDRLIQVVECVTVINNIQLNIRDLFDKVTRLGCRK